MTVKQFFTNVQNYWGKYDPGKLAPVADYVRRKISEKYLDLFLGWLYMNVTTSYNNQPDIADLVKAKKELAGDIDRRRLKGMNPGNHKQIAQLDDKGREEIQMLLDKLNEKLRWRNADD